MGHPIRRLFLQAELFHYRRKLRKAEIDLGLLGWQQVDFGGTSAEPQIEKIEQFEKEQAALVNVSADLSAKFQALQAERARVRAERTAALLQCEEACAPILKSIAKNERARREAQETLRRFRLALTELQNLPGTLARQAARRRALDPQTAQTRADVQQIHEEERRVAAELAELKQGHARAEAEIKRWEVELVEERAALAERQEEERVLQEKFAATDRALSQKARECTHGTHLSERKITSLDEEMSEPFRLIGQCLADHEIAPMNQPQALTAVEELREKIAGWEKELAEL